MIQTIKTMTKIQKEAFIDVLVIAGCAFFLGGYVIHMLTQDRPTWGQIVNEMPYDVKRDVAIDFCAANRRMCRTFPLSSPVQPMDSKK